MNSVHCRLHCFCYNNSLFVWLLYSGMKDKVLMVRMTQAEHEKLEAYAKSKDISMAKVVRDYVKKLPNLVGKDKFEEV